MSKTILHIDDEEEIRQMLADMLGASGYRVISVGSRLEAMRFVEREKPDLIIADLQLGEADGLDTIESLRALVPATPVMLLTGVLIDPMVARELLEPKGIVYLEKTQPMARILDEVRHLLNPAG
jgi:two-component system OmpR family response regulator